MHKFLKPFLHFRIFRAFRRQSFKPCFIFRVFRAFRRQSFVVVFVFSAFFVGNFSCSGPSEPRSRPRHTVSGRVSSSAVWQSGTDVLVSGRVQVALLARIGFMVNTGI